MEVTMFKFLAGFIFGLVVCTVGVTGLAKMMDNGVSKVQSAAKEASQ
jgi:hypothetical protein